MIGRVMPVGRTKIGMNRILGIVLFAIAASAALGQLPTSTILGVVQDSSGAVVPNAALTKTGETGGTITGVVKGASGEPLAGAMVKIKNLERGMTVAVFSLEQGHYRAGQLLPGKYTVQGRGGDSQSDPKVSVQVSGGQSVTVDLALTAPLDFKEGMTISQYAELMPDGEPKLIMVSLCTGCHRHGLGDIITLRKTRDGWRETVERMAAKSAVSPITEQEKEQLIDYLTNNFGRTTPRLDTTRVRPKIAWVKGEAAKAVITEYDLPSGAYTHDVSVDSKGIAWLSERNTGYIGRFDPNTFAYNRIPAPNVEWGGSMGFSLNAIAVDPQDRVWLTDGGGGGRLLMYDPKTEEFRSYPIPKPPTGGPTANTIRFHPNGTVWFTQISGNQIIRLDPNTRKFSQFPVPAGRSAKDGTAFPYGMAISRNGIVWFAESNTDKVGKVEPNTGEIVEYGGMEWRSVLKRMAADKEGNLWYGEFGGVGKLAMVDYRTGKITEYPTPTKYSGAYSVDVDMVNNFIWVNEMNADQIARFDPRTKSWVEYPLPTNFSRVPRIEIDPSRPNRVWYTGWYSDTVGFIDY